MSVSLIDGHIDEVKGDLISRSALLEKSYWHGELPNVENPYAEGASAVDVSDIEDAPAVDAVEVVRCMENKYAIINEYIEDRIHRDGCGNLCDFATKEARDMAFLKELEHLHNGIERQKWIPVTERLPTREDANWNERVLAIDDYLGDIQVYWYKVVANHASSFSHWMPLPQPPKEGE